MEIIRNSLYFENKDFAYEYFIHVVYHSVSLFLFPLLSTSLSLSSLQKKLNIGNMLKKQNFSHINLSFTTLVYTEMKRDKCKINFEMCLTAIEKYFVILCTRTFHCFFLVCIICDYCVCV